LEIKNSHETPNRRHENDNGHPKNELIETLKEQVTFLKDELGVSKDEKAELRVEIRNLIGIIKDQNIKLLAPPESPPPAPAETTEAKASEVQPEKSSNWLWAKTAPKKCQNSEKSNAQKAYQNPVL
jgi:hypothetical protein